MLKDANGIALPTLDSFNAEKCTPSAFAGGTANARGDDGGTGDPASIFTIVGDVEIGVFGVCTVDLVSGGGGTVALGLTDNSTLFMPATTATAIDVNEIWMDATPAIGKTLDSLSFYIVGNGEDVVETIGTADVTAGNIYYVALWRPLSPGSSVVATTPPTALPT